MLHETLDKLDVADAEIDVASANSKTEDGENDSFFKVILTGNISVGKTAILQRYIHDEFAGHYQATIGVNFNIKGIVGKSGKKTNLNLWDTSGEEQYRCIAKLYYREADGVILVYDITKRDTYDSLKQWIADIKENSPKDSVIVLVGNKSDLENERKVSFNEAKDFADKNSIYYFFETSARSGKNVPMIFQTLAEEMQSKYDEKHKHEEKPKEMEKIEIPAPEATNSKCC